MSKKILLIGGAGYIGCVLTRYFLDKDYLITSLDNLIYKNDQTFEQFKSHKNFKFILGDLRNQSLMGDLLDECDFCIILAAIEPTTFRAFKIRWRLDIISDARIILFLSLSCKILLF